MNRIGAGTYSLNDLVGKTLKLRKSVLAYKRQPFSSDTVTLPAGYQFELYGLWNNINGPPSQTGLYMIFFYSGVPYYFKFEDYIVYPPGDVKSDEEKKKDEENENQTTVDKVLSGAGKLAGLAIVSYFLVKFLNRSK